MTGSVGRSWGGTAPLLHGARCAPGASFLPSTAWEDESPADRDGLREAARFICQTCPALAPCSEWALGLSNRELRDMGAGGVVAGTSASAILRARRRARVRSATARPAPIVLVMV
jgi:hypothetical protein